MKTMKFFSMMCMLLLFSMSFVSCGGGDDDDEPEVVDLTTQFVGTYAGTVTNLSTGLNADGYITLVRLSPTAFNVSLLSNDFQINISNVVMNVSKVPGEDDYLLESNTLIVNGELKGKSLTMNYTNAAVVSFSFRCTKQ